MQAKQQSTTRSTQTSTRSIATKPRENAFSLLYLERARRREAEPDPGERFSDSPLALHARWTGPWEVERVPAGASWLHVATRRDEPAREGAARASLVCGATMPSWGRPPSRPSPRRTTFG